MVILLFCINFKFIWILFMRLLCLSIFFKIRFQSITILNSYFHKILHLYFNFNHNYLILKDALYLLIFHGDYIAKQIHSVLQKYRFWIKIHYIILNFGYYEIDYKIGSFCMLPKCRHKDGTQLKQSIREIIIHSNQFCIKL